MHPRSWSKSRVDLCAIGVLTSRAYSGRIACSEWDGAPCAVAEHKAEHEATHQLDGRRHHYKIYVATLDRRTTTLEYPQLRRA